MGFLKHSSSRVAVTNHWAPAAPEALFPKAAFTPPVEIWALGCLVFGILGDCRLGERGREVSRDIAINCGKLPGGLWETGCIYLRMVGSRGCGEAGHTTFRIIDRAIRLSYYFRR